MNLQDALISMASGTKVKLPEWIGYWFIPTEALAKSQPGTHPSQLVHVFTKTGDVLNTPWLDKYKDRDDFEVTDGKMGFEFAILSLKSGKKVARKGWNGKGMWLYMVPGSTFNVAEGRPLAAHLPVGEEVKYNAHIDMKAADGSHFAWNPNALDLLADDWEVFA